MCSFQDKLVLCAFAPLISTIIYCKFFNRRFVFSWYRPCYLIWMGVTYTYIYKGLKNYS